jgi:hypothetical protein
LLLYNNVHSNTEKICYKIYDNNYTEKFWVGLMDGNGSIQINKGI